MSYPTSTRKPRVTFTELETPFDAMPAGTTLDIACLDSTELDAKITSLGYSKTAGGNMLISGSTDSFTGLYFCPTGKNTGNGRAQGLAHGNAILVPAGTLKNLRFQLDAVATAPNATVATVQVNDVDTTITLTLDGSDKGTDLTHTVTVAAGDSVGLKINSPTGNAAAWCFELTSA